MAKTTYTATVNGRVLKRTTARTYTHVIVVRRLQADAEAEARRVTKWDRKNFDYYTECLTTRNFRPTGDYTEEALTARLAGGWEAYCERLIAARLAMVAASAKEGAYEWGAHGWAGSRDLAEKAAQRERNNGHWTGGVAVVAVGETVTL